MWRGAWKAAVVALVVVVAGCSDDSDTTTTAGPTTTAPTAPTTTVAAVASMSFTGSAREEIDLGDGWTAARCDGDAPLICVSDDGNPAGKIELATFPAASFHLAGFGDKVAAGDTVGAMELIAADFVRTFVADRKDGCGTDYVIEATAPEPATVLGQPGLRYGYTGTQDGKRVELQINHGTIVGDEVLLANASAYAPDGCVPPEGEFTPDVLEAFAPRLHALIASARR